MAQLVKFVEERVSCGRRVLVQSVGRVIWERIRGVLQKAILEPSAPCSASQLESFHGVREAQDNLLQTLRDSHFIADHDEPIFDDTHTQNVWRW